MVNSCLPSLDLFTESLVSLATVVSWAGACFAGAGVSAGIGAGFSTFSTTLEFFTATSTGFETGLPFMTLFKIPPNSKKKSSTKYLHVNN